MTKRFTQDTDRIDAINAAISMPTRLFGPRGREYRILSWLPAVEPGKAIIITASFLVELPSEVSPVDTEGNQS